MGHAAQFTSAKTSAIHARRFALPIHYSRLQANTPEPLSVSGRLAPPPQHLLCCGGSGAFQIPSRSPRLLGAEPGERVHCHANDHSGVRIT